MSGFLKISPGQGKKDAGILLNMSDWLYNNQITKIECNKGSTRHWFTTHSKTDITIFTKNKKKYRVTLKDGDIIGHSNNIDISNTKEESHAKSYDQEGVYLTNDYGHYYYTIVPA